MLVNISSFRSESATKKQQENFNTAFGFKPADGTRILKTLEGLSKEKVVNTEHLDTILGFLKSADADTVAAYARKAVAKANAVVFKALDKAKTLTVVINNLKKIKSTGIVVSSKPTSGSVSDTSGSSASLFSMIVPVTQDDAADVAFPPKSWYSKTGVKVEAFAGGKIDYDADDTDPGSQVRNFLFSGTKQQLEAFKLVMAKDDPDGNFGPYKITKFKMPKGYIPADQAKEYARKNGVKIKGLVGSDRKPVSATTTGSGSKAVSFLPASGTLKIHGNDSFYFFQAGSSVFIYADDDSDQSGQGASVVEIPASKLPNKAAFTRFMTDIIDVYMSGKSLTAYGRKNRLNVRKPKSAEAKQYKAFLNKG